MIILYARLSIFLLKKIATISVKYIKILNHHHQLSFTRTYIARIGSCPINEELNHSYNIDVHLLDKQYNIVINCVDNNQ